MEAFEVVLDLLADAVVASDENDRVIYINPAAERLLGWRRHELVGQPLTVLIPARMRAAHEAGFRRYVATRKPKIMGLPVRVPALRKDGTEIDVELTLSLLPHEPGLLVLASVRDLHDRVELERQIVAQQRLAAQNAVMATFTDATQADEARLRVLRALGENLAWHIGHFWEPGASGRLECTASWHAFDVEPSMASALCDELSFGRGEGLPGRVWRSGRPEWITGVDDAVTLPRRDAATRAGLQGAFAFPVLVNGSAIAVAEFFSKNTQPVDEELLRTVDTLGRQIGQFIDNARLFRALQRKEEWTAFLSEASKLLNSSLDVEETFRQLARLVVPRFGDWCSLEVLDGDEIRQVALAHADPSKVELGLALQKEYGYPRSRDAPVGAPSVIRTGRSELYEHIPDELLASVAKNEEHLRKLRAFTPRSALVVPLVARGRTLGALTLAWAESPRHYAAEDLPLMQELARRAGVAFDNARLYNEAQRAIRVREEFLSIASHELKTPLTSLQLQVGRLERLIAKGVQTAPAVMERVVERVTAIHRQVHRLGRLVEDLLDVSRVSAGEITLSIEPVDLAELIEEVVARHREPLQAAGCTVVLHVESPLGGRWDRMRLEQILSNFLSNAIKYAAGKPIEIVAKRRAGNAFVEVRDQGIGIAPADQRRIFERFGRAAPSEHYGGFGLGLWIVRLFVEKMGGRVGVESEPGKGSAFSVELPLQPEEELTLH